MYPYTDIKHLLLYYKAEAAYETLATHTYVLATPIVHGYI